MTDAYEKTEPPPPMPGPLVGSVVSGRYRIDALLGEGGMGAVYVGEHLLMHKRVAVKVLHPEMMGNAEVVARFEREAMAAAHIDHPNVAAATDFGKFPDGSFFLVLEYLEGASLRDVLERDGPFSEQRGLRVVRQIAAGLMRAHALRIVHRDLKPENVMLVDRDGDPDFVKISDFGIAKVPVAELTGKSIRTPQAQGGLTQLGVMYGTPEYMPPEQVLGAEIDARADLYALGIILYEVLVGERPFVSENRVVLVTMHVSTPPPPVRERAPNVSPATEALILQLLAKKPEERVQEARLVVERIDAILRGEGGLPATPGPPGVVARGDVASARTMVAMPASSVRAELERAHAQLPASMRSIPLVAMLAAAGGLLALVVVVLAVVIVVVQRPASPEAEGPGVAAPARPKDTAPEANLREARSKGVAALEALAAQYPKDGKIVRALIVALVAEKRKVDAMQAMTTLVARNPSAAEDEALLKAVRACAEDEGADDLAFELMEGPLGARGTELLYDLGSSKVAARAAKSLAKPEIRERSRAVAVALNLKAASSCDAKKALLPRLRDDGDKRSLPGLKGLKSTSGCGFLRRGDCWPCLRQGSDLATAIREIEARSETPAPASSDK